MKFGLQFTEKAEKDQVAKRGEPCAGDHPDLAYYVSHGYVENVAINEAGERKPAATPPGRSDTAEVTKPAKDGSVRRGFLR